MKHWKPNTKPETDICPEHYCFCWVPPKGKADLSGIAHDSLVEVIKASNEGPVFLHGGCASPIRPCIRETKNPMHNDSYEPFNSVLKINNLPELFFCHPELLDEDDKNEYTKMTKELWGNT